jgi:UDP-GlcNAc:undecaprenyl-phosphate GlcNAc-1-phosphate transferase
VDDGRSAARGSGFIDDLFTLPGRIRLIAQFVAISLMFIQSGTTDLPWYIIIPAFIFTLGWINGFNFMDGINAITPFYSLVALGTILWLNRLYGFVSPQLTVILILAVLIFSFFNARKQARAFAGDVGSISMAYLLAALLLALILKTGRFEYILLFFVYGLDIVFTIIYRLLRRENIFKAHRSHLYQWLSNEMALPHVLVAALYALVQLFINILAIALINQGKMSFPAFFIISVMLCMSYLTVRWMVLKNVKSLS